MLDADAVQMHSKAICGRREEREKKVYAEEEKERKKHTDKQSKHDNLIVRVHTAYRPAHVWEERGLETLIVTGELCMAVLQ